MDTFRSNLTRFQQQGAALGHFNVADLELLKAVVAAAVDLNVPVIVGASEGERGFVGTYELAALVRVMRGEHDIPVFLNADHTHSLAKAVEAAEAGFDSVVIDFSALPFDINVSKTKETVEAIKAINPAIIAEGEIGNIGTGSEIHPTVSSESRNLSTPEEARQFVDSTGIDVLAMAVSSAWRRREVGGFISDGVRSVDTSDAVTVPRASMRRSVWRQQGIRSLPASSRARTGSSVMRRKQ